MSRRNFKSRLIPGVRVTGIAEKGKGVGRDAEGRVIFLDDVAPGDVVVARVYKKKKDYFLGTVEEYTAYAPERVVPFCKHFHLCGGCHWQHLSYAEQLRQKQALVENALRRIGKVEPAWWGPILGADPPVYYRNKLEFSFSSKRWLTPEEIERGAPNAAKVLGFHPPGAFDKVIDIEECWLQPEPSNAIRNGVKAIAIEQQLPFFDIKANVGFLRTLMLRVTSLGQTLALFSFHEDHPKRIRVFLDAVLERFPQITTLVYCINPKLNDTVLDREMIVYSGLGYVEERLDHVRFRIGPKSFFQTNTRQAETLYRIVADFAGLRGEENVYDLYTGLGGIALYLAHQCRRVVGIEEVEAAADDARANAALNGIHNAVFQAGDVRELLRHEFAERHGRPDLLVTDPPRAGMHPDVTKVLIALAPPRIVYVSCNPATQARDLRELSPYYTLSRSQAVDLFPHTHHVENVALLEKK